MTIAVPQPVFIGNHFRVRQGFSWFSREYIVEHRSGGLIGVAFVKDYVLKPHIQLYSDRTKSTELLSIQRRSVLESSPNYDVVDSTTGQPLGSIRRNFWGSCAAKEWIVVNVMQQEIGAVKSGTTGFSINLFGFFFGQQRFFLDLGGHEIGIVEQRLNTFAPKLSLDVSAVPPERLDRRLAIAFGLILVSNMR